MFEKKSSLFPFSRMSWGIHRYLSSKSNGDVDSDRDGDRVAVEYITDKHIDHTNLLNKAAVCVDWRIGRWPRSACFNFSSFVDGNW